MNDYIQQLASTAADGANRTPALNILGKTAVSLGAVLFTASYFLPAVNVGDENVYRGSETALFTLQSLASLSFSRLSAFESIPALLNIFAPAYAILRLLRRWKAVQRICLCGSILSSIIVIVYWPVLLIFKGHPLVGYFTWLAGATLLLAPATGRFDIRQTD